MIRTIIKLGVFLVLALVGYNYFFGSETEKAQSKEIVGKVGDLGRDAWNLLRSERTKMKEGKYDDALEKMDDLYTQLRGKAEEIRDSEVLDDLQRLDERRKELEVLVRREGDELSTEGQRKLDDLTADTEVLMHEMEEKNQPGAPY